MAMIGENGAWTKATEAMVRTTDLDNRVEKILQDMLDNGATLLEAQHILSELTFLHSVRIRARIRRSTK